MSQAKRQLLRQIRENQPHLKAKPPTNKREAMLTATFYLEHKETKKYVKALARETKRQKKLETSIKKAVNKTEEVLEVKETDIYEHQHTEECNHNEEVKNG